MRQLITYFRNRILLPIPMLVKRNMQIPMDFECFGIARRRRFPEKKVLHGILGGANKGLGEAPKAARGRSMKARPTQSRGGVKGQLPLAGSRDSVPCGVWGNAPTVPRATSMPNALNKGAGSEASLPVTLRVRRRAPQAALPPSFREKPKKRTPFAFGRGCAPFVNQPSGLISVISKNSAVSLPLTLSTFSSSSSVTCWSTMRAPAVM